MDGNRRFWDRFSGHYGGFLRRWAGIYRQICETVRPLLEPDMDVLELACGTGQLSIPLSPWVRSWEATDFSPAMVERARRRGGPAQLRFLVLDATDLPYGPERFDAVVIANALHVMPRPEKALAEARRVLKPEGWLIAPTFVWGSGRWARVRLWIMGLSGFRVYHRWSGEELAAYLSGCGYAVLRRPIFGGAWTPLCCLIAKKRSVDPRRRREEPGRGGGGRPC